MRNHSIFALASLVFLAGSIVKAGTFVYQDDFETDKAKYESWDHSSFVDISLYYGHLCYVMGISGRGLGFYRGFEVDATDAYLVYATIPQSVIIIDGSVQFSVYGKMLIYGAPDGVSWTFLGTATGEWPPNYYSMPIGTGDPVQFLMFVSGSAIIDDLEIRVEYKYSGGTGTPDDPYRIATAEDLNDIGNHKEDWDKNFILINDVNLAEFTGTQFKIIGTSWNNPFQGVFDGNDHKVWNFTWSSTNRNLIGLFGEVGTAGQIKNLGLENIDVNATNGDWVGGLVGYNNGTMSNCHSAGSVTGGGWCVGGLMGNNWGTITNCYFKGSVSGNYSVGGLVGGNCLTETITNCYSSGSVSGYRYVGGFVGLNYGTITNCYSSSSVSGNDNVGGLVGSGDPNLVTTSFWDKDTSGQTTSIGGVGKTTAEMKTISTFTDAGWDFVEIWGIGENQTYPFLLTEPAGDSNHDKKVDLADLAILTSHWLDGSDR